MGLRLHLGDQEVVTKYVFPFVDDAWAVAFHVVDVMTLGLRMFHGSLELRGGALQATDPTAQLERIESTPLERFEQVVHFDPWWTFRGGTGVERDWVKAILASNISGTFNHEGTSYKVHDLVFTPALDAVDAIVAKDPVFRTVSFHRSDLELLLLRHPSGK